MKKLFQNESAVTQDTGNNPYLNARQEWMERYGSYIAQARNWRFFALAAAVALILSVAGNVVQATQYKAIPYVVSVDSLGNTHSVGIPRDLKPGDVPAQVIQSEIFNYITNWRSVTADADLQNRMLKRLIAFSSLNAKTVLQEWFKSNNPYKRAETNLVSIEMSGLPQPVAQNSWRAEWTETIRDRKGKKLDSTKYEATLTIAIVLPGSEQEIIENPLGIMVADLYFSKLLKQ